MPPGAGESTALDIRENPGFDMGAGDPELGLGTIDEKPEAPLPFWLAEGAGRVMKPCSAPCPDDFFASFFLFFFSVLPLARG